MTDTSDRENPSTAYARFPAPVVAVVLAAILAVLLAFGFYANANLRPQGIVVPTPVAAAALPTQTLAPTAAAVVQPTATTAAATPSVGLTPVAQVRETATSEAMPVPTVSPFAVTARATVSPELQTEVGDAYQTYWQVRAEALYDLDTTHLPEVMAGDHLASAEDLIAQLRIEGRAILTDVTHKYVVLDATSDTATVLDEYVDNSVYVDPLTHDKLTQPQGDTLKEQYEMNKIDEAWKVVTLIRGSQQP